MRLDILMHRVSIGKALARTHRVFAPWSSEHLPHGRRGLGAERPVAPVGFFALRIRKFSSGPTEMPERITLVGARFPNLFVYKAFLSFCATIRARFSALGLGL